MAIATLIPVYQYHAETPVWRYFYTTDPDIEEGWTRDGIIFYAFAAPSAEAVKVSRYYASDKNLWRYQYSTRNDLVTSGVAPGWAIDGGVGIGNDQPFYAFPSGNPGSNSRPVYQFVAQNPWRYAYSLNNTPPKPDWILESDPNLVTPDGVVFHVFDADVPETGYGTDYDRLRTLLEDGRWKEADQETARIMLESIGLTSEDGFAPGALERIPCTILKQLDLLWFQTSSGRFGFQVQQAIWQEVLTGAGGDIEIAGRAFGERIGQFNAEGQLIFYNDLTFDLSAPQGHLPILWWRRSIVLAGFGQPVASLDSRLRSCDS